MRFVNEIDEIFSIVFISRDNTQHHIEFDEDGMSKRRIEEFIYSLHERNHDEDIIKSCSCRITPPIPLEYYDGTYSVCKSDIGRLFVLLKLVSQDQLFFFGVDKAVFYDVNEKYDNDTETSLFKYSLVKHHDSNHNGINVFDYDNNSSREDGVSTYVMNYLIDGLKEDDYRAFMC